jgi:hypothetical protein
MSTSYIEWCNENEGRGYPIAEEATRVDDNGVKLPSDILADLGLLLPSNYTGLRLSSLYVSPTLISLSISADVGGLLTATFAKASVVPYTAYALTPYPGVDDVSGWVVFGNYRHLNSVPLYVRFATAAQSGLELRVVRVVPPPGVKRFQRVDNDPSIYATGIVDFLPGPQFVVEVDPANPQNIIVRLHGDVKSQYIEPCTRPATTDTCPVPPLRRINRVPPDADGVITLRFE